MSLSRTRLGANATGLPGPAPLPPLTAALSRRAALFGAVSVAGVTVATAVTAVAGTTTLSANDARLVAIADELRATLTAAHALIKDDARDCEEIPGFAPLESRRMAISDALFDVSPSGLAGLVAAADIVQQLADQMGGGEDQAGHGHNLACDVLRILGGRADA